MSATLLAKTVFSGVAALCSIVWLMACDSTDEPTPQPGQADQGLLTLSSKDELKARFNSDTGVPRLLLLMSPT